MDNSLRYSSRHDWNESETSRKQNNKPIEIDFIIVPFFFPFFSSFELFRSIRMNPIDPWTLISPAETRTLEDRARN